MITFNVVHFVMFLQVLSGMYILRFAVGAPLTEERHVNEAWELIQAQASLLLDRFST